jgi:hypothetical protein
MKINATQRKSLLRKRSSSNWGDPAGACGPPTNPSPRLKLVAKNLEKIMHIFGKSF